MLAVRHFKFLGIRIRIIGLCVNEPNLIKIIRYFTDDSTTFKMAVVRHIEYLKTEFIVCHLTVTVSVPATQYKT